MARRGRPRKAKPKHTVTPKDRVRDDIETVRRKAKLLGLKCDTIEDQRKVMARDASSPIAVLFSRGILWVEGDNRDRPQWPAEELLEVGEVYAWLYWRHIGTPHARIGGYRDVARGSLPAEHIADPDKDAAFERRFNAMSDVLDSRGRDVSRATKALVVDGCWPADSAPVLEFASCRWRLAQMIDGLAALVDWRRGRN